MTCTVMHTIELAHMLDATQLHLCTCWMLSNCTCAHVRCYAIALAHMFDATQYAHVRCYAIALAHMFDATQLHLRTGVFADVRELLGERVKQWTWRAELLRVNPHLSKQQFLKHLAKVC